MTAARDPLREQFEAWAIAHGVQLTLDIGGAEYHYPIAKGAWSAWQAATRRVSAKMLPEHRAVIKEAAQVFESGAAHNRKMGRTVFWRIQQDRADRLRAALAAAAPEENT